MKRRRIVRFIFSNVLTAVTGGVTHAERSATHTTLVWADGRRMPARNVDLPRNIHKADGLALIVAVHEAAEGAHAKTKRR